MMMIAVVLICRSLSLYISLAPLICDENLTRPEPQNIGESRADLDIRLPYYTAGFE